jgi:hypothetical protein
MIAAVAATQAFSTTPGLGAQALLPMPVKAPSNTTFDWTGWYIGGHFGYSRGSATGVLSNPHPIGSSGAFGDPHGGLHAGYNDVLSSRLLLGAEVAVSFPNFFEDGIVSSSTAARGSNITEKVDLRNRRTRAVAGALHGESCLVQHPAKPPALAQGLGCGGRY